MINSVDLIYEIFSFYIELWAIPFSVLFLYWFLGRVSSSI